MNKIYLFIFILIGCSGTQPTEQFSSLKPIDQLLEGNKRYASSRLQHPHQTAHRLKEISEAQNPYAVVVSCSDSRVPPEIIYDQGLGDLFVIRTAGNIIGDYELASIEYALERLNCKVIVITGHERCGAIQSFVEHPEDSLPGHMNDLLNFLRKEPHSMDIVHEGRDQSYRMAIHNIIFGVNLIQNRSTIVTNRVSEGSLEIYGAIYHMDTGKVQIIEDIVKK